MLYDNELPVNLPDNYVLTDNGAYDLERNGLSGCYVWVGYEHSRSATRNKLLYNGLDQVAKKVADSLATKYSATPVIEDKRNSTDMFRIYVKA